MRCSNRYVEFLLSFFLILLPPYLIELVTEYLYYSHFTLLYFFFSSFRLYFFIAYFGIASFYLGRKSSSVRIAWVLYLAALFALFALVYVFGCSPKVCYITGIDGLEPLRAFSFFLAEGLAVATTSFPGRNVTKNRNLDRKDFNFLRRCVLSVNLHNFGGQARFPDFPFTDNLRSGRDLLCDVG